MRILTMTAFTLGVAMAESSAAGAAQVTLTALAPRSIVAIEKPACAKVAVPASVASINVEMPPLAEELFGHYSAMETTLEVDLAADGKPTLVQRLATSGSIWLDQSALSGARDARYNAEIAGCAPVSGAYKMIVSFSE